LCPLVKQLHEQIDETLPTFRIVHVVHSNGNSIDFGLVYKAAAWTRMYAVGFLGAGLQLAAPPVVVRKRLLGRRNDLRRLSHFLRRT
jgi:hypothetical protein